MNPYTDGRVGRFFCHAEFWHDEEVIRPLLNLLVPLAIDREQTARNKAGAAVVYEITAYGQCFEPLMDGEQIPTYRVIFEKVATPERGEFEHRIVGVNRIQER